MPIASFKCVREVSSEDAVHVAENLLKESAGKKWRTKSGNEKSAYVILEFQEPQQITGIDIGNEHSAFIEVLVSRTGCQTDDFRELLLSSSFMTPIESKNSSNQNRVRCFSSQSLDQTTLPEKWKLLKIVCTQPFNRHVQYGISFVKVHVVAAAPAPTAAPAKVKSLLPERMMQFGAFKLREESPDSENDSQLNRFQSWKKESHLKQSQQPPAATTTAAAIRDAGNTALKRLSIGKVSASLPKPSPNHSPVPTSAGDASDVKPLDRNRASLLFGEDDDDEDAAQGMPEQNAKKRRLSKHLEADKDRRRLEQEQLQKEKERKKDKSKSRHSLDKSISKENKSSGKEEKSARKELEKEKEKEKTERSSSKESKPASKTEDKHESRSKHREASKSRDNSRPSTQKRLSSSPSNTPAKKPRIRDQDSEPIIQYRPFNQLLNGVVLVISGIQNPDRADLRSKATALGAKYKADWEPGCTHLICAFKNTPKYNQVKGKGKIVTRSWIEKCYNLRKYLPWRRYALDTNDLGQPESDEELCDEARKPSSRRESNEEDDETIKVTNTYDADPKDKKKVVQHQEEASSGIDTEDELQRVADENRKKKTKHRTPVKAKSNDDIYDVSTEEEDFLIEKKKQTIVID
ncbi:LOW QUALITY PROTEIN: DNA repair protein XRCC1 [Drosophila serrata]|uniref:LOW QUALITY PROTEIN: DNA repair protein XRCC1 n=1 Tax=Drosophila serrata TaxID=7274 RepID=UPI000A1D2789|nr:LOW QUALITY PROTEIN: DNA repair protein XRCC1 [Drosophila serrata]